MVGMTLYCKLFVLFKRLQIRFEKLLVLLHYMIVIFLFWKNIFHKKIDIC